MEQLSPAEANQAYAAVRERAAMLTADVIDLASRRVKLGEAAPSSAELALLEAIRACERAEDKLRRMVLGADVPEVAAIVYSPEVLA